MLFDTHCHLDFDQFEPDREQVLARAHSRGVTNLLVPGVAPSRWAQQLGAIHKLGLHGALGIHPFWAHEVAEPELATVLASLGVMLRSSRIVALGECGLDAPTVKRGGADFAHQLVVLERQLGLARELELPVVLHCVHAHGRLLELLDRIGPLPAGGVLHAYSGSAELVARYAAHGLYFGFGGAVTRPRALRARAALERVPADRLLLETDAPDQPPLWREGRNEPGELAPIAAQIAGMLGIELALLAQQTNENARALFRLKTA